MKAHFPSPTFPKTRLQIAAEYNMDIKAFRRKLKQAGIELPRGQIIPADQIRIYRALGAPSYVWTKTGEYVLFDV